MKRLFLMPVLAVFLLACTTTTAKIADYAGLGAPSDPVPFNKQIRTGQLANGLAYYILENSRPENRAYLTLAVNAGSILEEEDERGLAHFVEHMAFNGTARFPELELINYLRSLGMRFGPEVNAYTTYDQTVYGIEVPVEIADAGEKRIPNTALAIIDDWTHAITFTPKDVDDERLIIAEEYRTRLGAAERIRQKILPAIFHDSRYAERSPKGLPEIVVTAPAEKLLHFYQTWYRTDNMAVIFVGNFDGAALEAELNAHFSAPVPTTPLNRPTYDLPPPKRGTFQVEVVHDPEQTTTLINWYYKRPQLPLKNDLASYRVGIIDSLISRILSLRFDEATARPEMPYISASTGHSRYGVSSRYYIMSASAKTGMADATIRELFLQKEAIIRFGFTHDEIERAKRSFLSDIERLASEKDNRDSSYYVNALTYCFIDGGSIIDIDWELDAVRRLLPAIPDSDVSAVGKSYFAADDLIVLVVAPDAVTVPTPDQIKQIATDAHRTRIDPPESTEVNDQLLEALPNPGRIVAESLDPETGALTWKLSNGATVILKETTNRNNEIILYALAKGGNTTVPIGQNVSAQLAAELAAASGIGDFSLPELTKKLADKQVSLSLWISGFIRGVQGFTTTGDSTTFFELLYLTFTRPRIDPVAFSTAMDQYRTILAQRSDSPENYFSDEVTKIMYGSNPRFNPLTVSDLTMVRADDALTFLNKSLNPADWTFVFTGSIDRFLMRNLVQNYLAAIPRRNELFNAWTAVPITRPGAGKSVLYKGLYTGKDSKSMVYLASFQQEPFVEKEAMTAQVLNDYLNISLIESIREKLGGTYSIGVGVALSSLPPGGELTMSLSFVCDPERAPALAEAVQREITAIADGKVDADLLAKAIAARTKTWEQSMQSNSYIARLYANFSVLFNLPFANLDRRPSDFAAVTVNNIQEMSRRLVKKGTTTVILYPEGWIR
jgi:zinc protease